MTQMPMCDANNIISSECWKQRIAVENEWNAIKPTFTDDDFRKAYPPSEHEHGSQISHSSLSSYSQYSGTSAPSATSSMMNQKLQELSRALNEERKRRLRVEREILRREQSLNTRLR